MEQNSHLKGFRLFLLSLGIGIAAFMVSLDGFIVNVAIPTISGELGVREDLGTWIITLFTMSSTLFVPTSGWLAARLGHTVLFAIASVLFSIFSLLCGMSTSFNTLLIFRIFQGACAGIITPLSLSLIIANFPENKRGVAIGFWSFFVMVGPAMGPMIGGWFSDYYWSWMFFINFPIGILSAATVACMLWAKKDTTSHNFTDWIGLSLLFLGIGSIQIALNRGNVDDWFRAPLIPSLLAIGFISIVFFIVWELFHPNPFVDLRYFKVRNFTLGSSTLGFAMAILFSSFVLDSLWVQQVLGYTPAWAGYTLTPVGLFPLIFYPLMGRFVALLDIRIWIGTSFLFYAGTFFWLSRINLDFTFWDLALPRLFQGIGFATFTVPNSLAAIRGVSAEKMTFAISLFSFVRILLVGFAIPLAVNAWMFWTAFFQSRMVEQTFEGNPPFLRLLAPFQSLDVTPLQADALAASAIANQASTLAIADLYYCFAWMFIGLACTVFFYKKAASTAPAKV